MAACHDALAGAVSRADAPSTSLVDCAIVKEGTISQDAASSNHSIPRMEFLIQKIS
jgi:hypothetical protein